MSDLNPYEEGLAMELAESREGIKELEAKLAKAVEALEEIIEMPTRRYQRKIARTALAELKGGKDA